MQARVLVHPVYHGYHSDFCECLKPSLRIGFLQSNAETNANNDGHIFVACIPRVDKSLYQNWVFLPGILYLLLNVLMVIAQRSDRWQAWRTSRYNPHKNLKRQYQPGKIRFNKKQARTVHAGEAWCADLMPTCTL